MKQPKVNIDGEIYPVTDICWYYSGEIAYIGADGHKIVFAPSSTNTEWYSYQGDPLDKEKVIHRKVKLIDAETPTS